MFVRGLVKTCFIKPSKWYRETGDCRLKKWIRKEEIFLLQNQKNTGKKKMIHDIESLMPFPPPNLIEVESLRGTC